MIVALWLYHGPCSSILTKRRYLPRSVLDESTLPVFTYLEQLAGPYLVVWPAAITLYMQGKNISTLDFKLWSLLVSAFRLVPDPPILEDPEIDTHLLVDIAAQPSQEAKF
ncbi:hypothetical protein N7486_010969 [Penicillium sp. IBT 16267x]|nr:hypothetical protein N7486_010969 [Penicillium sp. IBT 16267x]